MLHATDDTNWQQASVSVWLQQEDWLTTSPESCTATVLHPLPDHGP